MRIWPCACGVRRPPRELFGAHHLRLCCVDCWYMCMPLMLHRLLLSLDCFCFAQSVKNVECVSLSSSTTSLTDQSTSLSDQSTSLSDRSLGNNTWAHLHSVWWLFVSVLDRFQGELKIAYVLCQDCFPCVDSFIHSLYYLLLFRGWLAEDRFVQEHQFHAEDRFTLFGAELTFLVKFISAHFELSSHSWWSSPYWHHFVVGDIAFVEKIVSARFKLRSLSQAGIIALTSSVEVTADWVSVVCR